MIDDRSLDELLSRAGDESSASPELIDRVEARILGRRRARRSLGGGAFLAAIATGMVLLVSGTPSVPSPSPDPNEPMLADATKPARVVLDNAYLTQRLESNHPNVTIVRVYQRFVDVEADSPADPASLAPRPALPDLPQTQLATRSS